MQSADFATDGDKGRPGTAPPDTTEQTNTLTDVNLRALNFVYSNN